MTAAKTEKKIYEQKTGRLEEEVLMADNKRICTSKFTPLMERMKKEKPDIADCLAKIREKIGEETFDKRFNVLQNINRAGSRLLIVSGSERLRTLLIRDHLKDITDAFGVDNVRIVGGAGFGGVDAF